MKTPLLACFLLAGAPLLAQISVGIRIGPPPPPRVVRVLPPRPAPEHVWVDGYWYPVGSRYRWHDGYWTRPAYDGARWVAPRYDRDQYYVGHWEGPEGPREHDHHSDRDRDRDFPGRGRGRGRGHDK